MLYCMHNQSAVKSDPALFTTLLLNPADMNEQTQHTVGEISI